MKLKFVFLSLLVCANIGSLWAGSRDDHSVPGYGGGLVTKSFASDIDVAAEVRIYNMAGQEVDKTTVDQLDFSLELLSSGEYQVFYINSSGGIVSQFYFSVE